MFQWCLNLEHVYQTSMAPNWHQTRPLGCWYRHKWLPRCAVESMVGRHPGWIEQWGAKRQFWMHHGILQPDDPKGCFKFKVALHAPANYAAMPCTSQVVHRYHCDAKQSGRLEGYCEASQLNFMFSFFDRMMSSLKRNTYKINHSSRKVGHYLHSPNPHIPEPRSEVKPDPEDESVDETEVKPEQLEGAEGTESLNSWCWGLGSLVGVWKLLLADVSCLLSYNRVWIEISGAGV